MFILLHCSASKIKTDNTYTMLNFFTRRQNQEYNLTAVCNYNQISCNLMQLIIYLLIFLPLMNI